MKNRFLVLVGLIASFPGLSATYSLDTTHTNVLFKVKHLVISTVTGRFNQFQGTLEFDDQTMAFKNLQTEIVASSIDTNEKDRDAHLKNKDFFEVEKYPKITFKAPAGKFEKGKKSKLDGELTIRGVTKKVTFDVEFKGQAKDPWGNEKIVFEATTKINRKDFGIAWNKKLDQGGVVVSEDVQIIVEVEANKNKA